jgi:serine/threonine protein kinase/outer membrane protein assembly factor BamB
MLPLGAEDPRVIGEFRLHARLGAGGMGRVFLGSSPGGRAVAVKVVHPHLARDTAFTGRFRREVAAALVVNGGYAAPVIAAGPDDDPPWLATAYVPGPSLQEAVTATGPLPEEAVLKLTAGLAEALRVIHRCGLVHRDLKPSNVLLAADGPRVIDFGIARALDGTVLTSAESLLGTPSFMSPEQAQSQPAGPASDVFSLGGVAYFAATGSNPFGTGHPAVMLYRIVHTEPDLEQLPPGLRDLTAACLAKDAAQRPTPAELAAALAGVIPPGDSPAAFWPAPVARIIGAHQAGLSEGPPTAPPPAVPWNGAPSNGAPSNGAPSNGALSHGALSHGAPPTQASVPVPATPPSTVVQMPPDTHAPFGRPDPPGSWEPVTPRMPLAVQAPAGLGGPGLGGTGLGETGLGGGGLGETGLGGGGPAAPPMGRRRALAALAGMAAGGLAVAGWEATRPHKKKAPATNLAGGRTPKPRTPAGTKVWSFTAGNPVQAIAVGGGTVFAGTTGNKVYALDAATGRQLWQRSTTRQFNDTMAVAGKAVYIADALDGGTYALDAATGRQLWSVPTQAPLGLVVFGDVLYLGTPAKSRTTGGVSALSTKTGGLLWNAEFGPVSDVTGGLAVADGTVYATSSNGEISAYDAASGVKRWRISGKKLIFGGPPLVADGVIYACGTADSDIKTTALYAVRAATHGQLWQQPMGVSQFPPGMTIAGDVIFAAFTRSSQPSSPGDLNAMNAATGKPLWKVKVASGAYPAPVVAGGVVYSGSNNGVLTAWQADTGNKLWSFSADDGMGTAIEMAGGNLYFGAGKRIYAVSAQQ